MVGFVAGPSGVSAVPKTTLRENWKCFSFCLIVAISNFQYGFDTGIINGFQAMQGFLRVFGVPHPNGVYTIGTTFQQLITSLLQLGLVISSVFVGPFSMYFGRRAGFALGSIFAVVGITIQVLVTVQWPIYIGRLILGIGNGIYVNLTVLYISEIAPAHLRGLMVAAFQIFVNVGGFIGAVVSNAEHNNLSKHSYQIQLGILYIVPVYLFFAVWFLPESPRWLADHERVEEARHSLERLRPKFFTQDDITLELKEIQEAIRIEREIESSTQIQDMWKGSDLRRTLLSIACSTFHAASGVNFIVGYGTFFFQIAGTGKPFTNTIILQSVNVVTALCAMPLARRFGRRTLLLVGFSVTFLSMFCVAIIYTVRPHDQASGKGLVALLCIFIGTYGATIGPLSWVTAGEMSSNHLRSYTFGVGMGIGFIFAWLTTFTTPYFINAANLNWGAKVAWIWAPSNLITLIFIFFFLPETKGRKLEELDELFFNRVPARKFSTYKCHSIIEDSNENVTSVMDADGKLADSINEKA